MQRIMSVIIYMNESKLKPKGQPKSLSDLEQNMSRSGSNRQVAIEEISSRSIPMQGIESVQINVIENKLKHKG